MFEEGQGEGGATESGGAGLPTLCNQHVAAGKINNKDLPTSELMRITSR
jgi:hypothetical protein